MLSFLPGSVKGILSLFLFSINTIFWVSVLLIVAVFRLIFPVNFWYKLCSKISIFIANSWIMGNNLIIALIMKITWEVSLPDDLRMDRWYLVISNHQSWVDILSLQKVFLGKIPFLKFFLKKELITVPVLGPAWWALEFPFMKRYSKEFIKKNPHLKNKDIDITRKACEKFKTMPTSIMNFVEGTRFTKEKNARQNTGYVNLLKPKAGGISYVMNIMGDLLNDVVNVTIYYPDGAKTFWQFLCGDVKKIIVTAEVMSIPQQLKGNHADDPEFSMKYQSWINGLWKIKDKHIEDEMKRRV